MSLWRRPDSPFWWMRIEGTSIRRSTGIPVAGASPTHERELRKQALQVYADAKATHELEHRGLEKKPPTVRSFRQHADWFMKNVTVHQRGRERADSMVRQLLLYFARFDDLRAITKTDIREWMTWRSESVQPSTVNRERDVLRAMLRAAVPDYLETNPVTDVHKLRQPETEARVIAFDEEQALLAKCGDVRDRAFLMMGIDTGMRLGSLLGLRWEQVKLDLRVIVSLNAKVSDKPKPMSSRLYAALKDIRRTDSPYVFSQFHTNETGQSAKNKATRFFELICKIADVPHGRIVNGVTIHSMRHTCASRLAMAGVDAGTICEILGWRNLKTPQRYMHRTPEHLRDAVERIASGQHVRETERKKAQ